MDGSFALVAVFWILFAITPQNAKRQKIGPCGHAPDGKKTAKDVLDNGNRVEYDCMPQHRIKAGNTSVYCDSDLDTWVGEPLVCEDAVNCINRTLPCINGGICEESDPSFSCLCPAGFYGALCDEANGNWGDWGRWSNCSSTCSTGVKIRRRYCDNPKPTPKGMPCKGPGMQSVACTQPNCPESMFVWCEKNSDRCDVNSGQAFCSAKDGSFHCTCLQGVTAVLSKNDSFVRCEDIDECANGAHPCPTDSTICVNTYGSYGCECKDGHKRIRGVCLDIDECSMNLHTCDENATCINRQGGYECKCNDGFRSLNVNGTGHEGQCQVMRVLLYGSREHQHAQEKSPISGELMTDVIVFPTGIPLEDEEGNATENGVLLITNLTTASELLDTYRHPAAILAGTNPISGSSNVCALIAPFWSDAQLNDKSKLWYHLYDMDELEGKERNRGEKGYKLFKEIKKLFPENFDPKYVAVVTWSDIRPPWPSKSEGLTFQTILATDGVRTYVSNIYEDRAMTWRPVYDVPLDMPMYQAATGLYIDGKSPKVWFHESSGKWSEPFTGRNDENVYKLDGVRFLSTGEIGVDTHPLTPTVDFQSSAKHMCFQWFRKADTISDDVIQKLTSCPPYESLVREQLNVTWIEAKEIKTTTVCYTWNFVFFAGGTFDCCYDKRSPKRPLVYGINAFERGAGFYHVNKTDDVVMRHVCCYATSSNYFCDLYTQKRPPTAFYNFKSPIQASVKSGLNITATSGKNWSVTGSGEASLLRVERIGRLQPILNMDARYKEKNEIAMMTALALRTENFTLEIYGSENQLECFFNNKTCEKSSSTNVSFAISESEIKLSTRSGIFLRTWNSEQKGLEFEALLPQETLYTEGYVTSGLLSDAGQCYVTSFTSRVPIDCDLQTIAEDKKLPVEDISIFSRTPSGFYEQPMTVYKTDHANTSIPVDRDPTPSVPDQVNAVAHLQPTGRYEVKIKVRQIPGNVTVRNYDGTVERSRGTISFLADYQQLNGLNIEVTENNAANYLIFPNIFICNCGENGKCDPDAIEEVPGPFPIQAPCICEKNYRGVRCEDKVEPCSWHPCFANVLCDDQSSATANTVAYDCGSCPDRLEAGDGESCYHDNPCARDAGSPGAHECENATCYNEVGRYRCECRTGYQKSSNPYKCYDINECEELNVCGNKEETCVNTEGSYKCVSSDTETENHEVVDINECLDNNGGCERRCKNTNGSYYCFCEAGFKLLEDKRSCKAIDECEEYGNEHCTQFCIDSPREKPFRCECDDRHKLADDYTTCIPLFSTEASTLADPTTSVLTSSVRSTVQSTSPNPTTKMEAQTSTSKRITTTETQKTNTHLTTAIPLTTTPGLYESLSKTQKELWDYLRGIPGFDALTDDEKRQALELLEALIPLLKDQHLLQFLSYVDSLDTLPSQCSDLQIFTTQEDFDFKRIEDLLGGVDALQQTYLNPKVLNLILNIPKLLGDTHMLPLHLSIGTILSQFVLLRRCIDLWNAVPTTEAVKIEVKKRHTTLKLTTVVPGKKISLSLPWILAWIAVAVTAIVVILFVSIIVGTRLCFKRPNKSDTERRAIARQKKLEKMQQWPRVVMSSCDKIPEKCLHQIGRGQKPILYH